MMARPPPDKGGTQRPRPTRSYPEYDVIRFLQKSRARFVPADQPRIELV